MDDNLAPGAITRGVSWSALNAAVLRFAQFAFSIVIARLVSPQEFGVFAVGLTVYTIIVNISELGVGSALVREVKRTKQVAPTVATITLMTSCVLATGMIVAASPLARLLGAVEAANVVRVLALTVVIGAAGAVPAGILTRDYRQKERFLVDVLAFIVSSVAMLLLIFIGAGVMALAWSRIVAQLTSTLAFLLIVKERYWPGFSRAEAKDLLRFGLPLAGANLLGYTIATVDFMVVGGLLGALALGYYNLAFTISGWPVSLFTAVLTSVTLTTLSRVQHSRHEMERQLAAALATLAACALPVSALSAVLALPLITSVYGQRWAPAAAALSVLALFGSIRVLIALLSDLLVALGRTATLLWLQALWLLGLVPALLLAVRYWGIAGAAVAHLAVAVVVVIPGYVVALKFQAPVGLGWIWQNSRRPLIAALACGLVASLIARQIDQALIACLLGGILGGLTYLLALNRWIPRHLAALRMLYSTSSRRRPQATQARLGPVS